MLDNRKMGELPELNGKLVKVCNNLSSPKICERKLKSDFHKHVCQVINDSKLCKVMRSLTPFPQILVVMLEMAIY